MLPWWQQEADFLLFLTALGWFLSGFIAFELRHRAKRIIGSFPAWGEFAFFCWILSFRSVLLLFGVGGGQEGILPWVAPASLFLAAIAVAPLLFSLLRSARYRITAMAMAMVILLCVLSEFWFRLFAGGDLWSSHGGWGMSVFLLAQLLPAWVCLGFLAATDYRTRPFTSDRRLLARPGVEILVLLGILGFGFLLLQTARLDAENELREGVIGKVRVSSLPLFWRKGFEPVNAMEIESEFSPLTYQALQILEASDQNIVRVFFWEHDGGEMRFLSGIREQAEITQLKKRLQLFADKVGEGEFIAPGFRVVGPFWEGEEALVSCIAEIGGPAFPQPTAWLGIDYDARIWFDSVSTARLRIFGLLAVLGVGLILLRTYRSRFDEISHFEKQKREIAKQERERIGVEIHNDLGQRLAAVSLQAAALKAVLPESNNEGRRLAEEISRTAMDATKEAREISLGLLPELQLKHGLGAALSQMTERAKTLFPVRIELAMSDEVAALAGGKLAATLFRITQECVTNAVRHGHATDITITATLSKKTVVLLVWDNGKGFDPMEAAKASSGMGLSYLMQQVRDLEGKWEIDSSPGSGTSVRVLIPWRQRHLDWEK